MKIMLARPLLKENKVLGMMVNLGINDEFNLIEFRKIGTKIYYTWRRRKPTAICARLDGLDIISGFLPLFF